ncbi:uncharacterized protein LOC141596054 [Silene latifolia]|uniref:uncharacterized protein LOC141596054 n=1 Tax=Silene latifolia TaxID=37657 RepID=UPI003D77B12D
MGCCLSTLENKPKPNPNPNPNSNSNPLEKNHQFSCVSKSPPRPEEETVKEVLSETPKPKPKQKPEFVPESEPKPELEIKKTEDEPIIPKLVVSPKKPISDQKLNKNDPTTPEEISEVSEMQSVSETISTTTLEDQQQWAIKDSANSGELHQRRYSRSQGQNRNLHNNKPNFNTNGNVNHRRSPVRKRVDPSPPRRKYPGPGQGPGLVSGPGRENSTRRSRSPATRNNVGRSPSGRRVGSSPGRVRMVGGPENGRKVDEEKGKGNGNESEMDGPKESLENPLVSLECFIFL